MKLFTVLLLCLAVCLVSGANPPCPSYWRQFNSYCYYVSSSSKTWQQAQAFCKALGGELVKITSAEENDFVLALARKYAPATTQVWIGLEWNSIVKDFLWSDISVPVYKNWAPHEPNGKAKEPCSNMWTRRKVLLPYRASGYWNDRTCGSISSVPCGLVCKRLP